MDRWQTRKLSCVFVSNQSIAGEESSTYTASRDYGQPRPLGYFGLTNKSLRSNSLVCHWVLSFHLNHWSEFKLCGEHTWCFSKVERGSTNARVGNEIGIVLEWLHDFIEILPHQSLPSVQILHGPSLAPTWEGNVIIIVVSRCVRCRIEDQSVPKMD